MPGNKGRYPGLNFNNKHAKRDRLFWYLLASFIIWVTVVSVYPSSNGTLGPYTDHLNYETSAWFFLQRGFEVFTVPMEVLAPTCHTLHPYVTWGELPYIKTLGNLLVFLPFAAMDNLGVLPEVIVHKLIIIFFLLIAHITIYYFIAELKNRHTTLAIMLTLSALFYMSLIAMTLNGFSEAMSILFIVLTIRFLREERNTNALLCYTLAVFMHYRALYLFPLGIYALLNLYKEGKLSLTSLMKTDTSAKAIYGFVVVAAVLTVYTAYLTWIEFPYARTVTNISIPSGKIYGNPLNLEFFSPATAIPVFTITGATILYLVRKRELLTASTVATSLLCLSLVPVIQIFYALFLCPIPLISGGKGRRVALFWVLLSGLILVVSIYQPEISRSLSD